MAQNWNKIDAIDINKIEDSRTKQRQSPFESESYFKLPIFSRCVSERQNGILVRIDFQFRTITLLSNLIFVVANISYYFSIIYIYSDRKNVEGMLRWVLGEYTYTWWLYSKWSFPAPIVFVLKRAVVSQIIFLLRHNRERYWSINVSKYVFNCLRYDKGDKIMTYLVPMTTLFVRLN